MKEWKKVKIGDIASLSNGINFNKSAYTKGVKLIGVSDFGDRVYPNFETLQEIKKEVVRSADYLKEGDIVFVRSNGNKELVGRCMLINKDIPLTYSGFCIRLRINDKEVVNPTFLTYLCKSNDFRKKMSGTAVGANIQNLSQGRLGNCIINLPSIAEQRKIATILSRYDSLIENYQKQIKLLEEAAQRLYKEWFIDLRFPGYENTKIVDGIPEGWEKKRLGNIANFKRGKTITKKDVLEGSVPVVAGGLEPAYYCNKSNTEDRVITISGSGANAGFTRMYFEKIWASDCSYVDNDSTSYLYFIYCFLVNSKAEIGNMQKGAAQPHVYAKDINSLVVLTAPDLVVESFDKYVKCYFEEIAALSSQLRLLTEARDRLLPKLMSGEIEV